MMMMELGFVNNAAIAAGRRIVIGLLFHDQRHVFHVQVLSEMHI